MTKEVFPLPIHWYGDNAVWREGAELSFACAEIKPCDRLNERAVARSFERQHDASGKSRVLVERSNFGIIPIGVGAFTAPGDAGVRGECDGATFAEGVCGRNELIFTLIAKERVDRRFPSEDGASLSNERGSQTGNDLAGRLQQVQRR